VDPFDDIKRFEKIMKEMMEGLFGGARFEVFTPMRAGGKGRAEEISDVREPLTDINETKDEVLVTLELPGASKDNIDLDVEDRGIEISAKIHKLSEGEDKRSSSFTRFQKFLTLPCDVDPNSVKATYNNGILEVHLNKLKKSKGKKVKIE
jgi:HSP20 family protein